MDQTNLLEKLIDLLNGHEIQYCVIGGQAVNAYVEPLVSLDLDLAVTGEQLSQAEMLLSEHFHLRTFPHSINVSIEGSALRVQIQTDARYAAFTRRASQREVLGLVMPVADIKDVLQGKIWAVQDPERRGSKRQKDLADIARLIEAYPQLREQVPEEVLQHLI